MKDLYDFLPCAVRAVYLRDDMNARLLASLDYLFGELTPWIGEKNVDIARNRLHHLAQQPRLSGYLHAINHSLADAIQEENVPLTKRLVEAFLLDNVTVRDFQISNFDPQSPGLSAFKFDLLMKECMSNEDHYDLKPSGAHTTQSIDISTYAAERALRAIGEVEPSLLSEIKSLVNEVYIINSRNMRAGSGFRFFGIIYLHALKSNENWCDYAELIVHESAHTYLFSLMASDPLVTNDPEARFASPLRVDPRPMAGIYHAVFVLARMVYILQLLSENPRCDAADKQKLRALRDRYAGDFWDGFNTVAEYATLTSLGKAILDNLPGYVGPAPSAPPPSSDDVGTSFTSKSAAA